MKFTHTILFFLLSIATAFAQVSDAQLLIDNNTLIKQQPLKPATVGRFNDEVINSKANINQIARVVASGTNTYTATVTPAITTYSALKIYVTFANANTTTSTLNLNGIGAVTIVKGNNKPLVFNDIQAGKTLLLAYDGTYFQLQIGLLGNSLLSGTVINYSSSDLRGPIPTAGNGSEASPYSGPDNTADLQLVIDSLDLIRGGKISLAAKRYDITTTTGVIIDSACVDIESLSAGKQANPNGEFEGKRGNKIYFPGTAFTFQALTTPRINGHLRKLYLYSPTALQPASTNGSNGVGTKGIYINGYLEQANFDELKMNNLDFGVYNNTGSGTFFDVLNFRHNLILGGRYGMYYGSSGTGVYNQLTNNVIADGLKHAVYVSNNDRYYHWSLIGNTFARSSGASGILDNPSNVFHGQNYSSFMGNIVTGAGLDYYPTPTQYTADGMVLSGDYNSITGNIIRDNVGASSYGLRVSGNSNYATGNIFQGNTNGNLIFDASATSNWIQSAGNSLTAWTDNGSRNFVNGVSKNAGDPATTGVWNGQTKNSGYRIWDTSGNIFYDYINVTGSQNVRVRYTTTALHQQNIGTAAGDQAVIGAINSTHSMGLYTTTALAGTFPSSGIVFSNATNGMRFSLNGTTSKMDISSTGVAIPSTATDAGFTLNPLAGNPSSLVNGNLWVNSTAGHIYARVGGTSYQLDQQTSSPGGSNTQLQYNNGGVFGGAPLFRISSNAIQLGSTQSGGMQLYVESVDTDSDLILAGKADGSIILGTAGGSWEIPNAGIIEDAHNTVKLAPLLVNGGSSDISSKALIEGGSATGSAKAGKTEIRGGPANSGDGGDVLIKGGSSVSGNPGYIIMGSGIALKDYTVATLPTYLPIGSVAYVTDALAPTYLTIVVGGGAIVTPVFYNGTNWVAH